MIPNESATPGLDDGGRGTATKTVKDGQQHPRVSVCGCMARWQ